MSSIGLGMDYPMSEKGPSIRRATITERLEHEKLNLTERLGEVTKALDALNKNPELQNLIDLVSKVA